MSLVNKKATFMVIFQRSILLLILIGQLALGTLPYATWLFGGEQERVALFCCPSDSDVDCKEHFTDKEPKLLLVFLATVEAMGGLRLLPDLPKGFITSYYPEVTTPPPEFFF